MEEFVEVIGVEHLKTVLSGLSPEEIVKPAYDNWQAGIKTGHTVLNLETGNVLISCIWPLKFTLNYSQLNLMNSLLVKRISFPKANMRNFWNSAVMIPANTFRI